MYIYFVCVYVCQISLAHSKKAGRIAVFCSACGQWPGKYPCTNVRVCMYIYIYILYACIRCIRCIDLSCTFPRATIRALSYECGKSHGYCASRVKTRHVLYMNASCHIWVSDFSSAVQRAKIRARTGRSTRNRSR